MTHRATNRRLRAMHDAIHSLPLQLHTIDGAYATFLRTGELPTVQPLAKSVLRRALLARKASADREAMPAIRVVRNGKPTQPRVAPREQVFGEAAYADEPVRSVARTLIDTLVKAGGDPTDPEFIPSDIGDPEFGSMALHVLGWPDQWVAPQYEQQMARVLKQHRCLRLLPNRDEAWYLEAAKALVAFRRRGVHQETVFGLYALTMSEMFAIHAQHLGKGGDDLLAAFEAVATTAGPEREGALRHLGELQVQRQEAS